MQMKRRVRSPRRQRRPSHACALTHMTDSMRIVHPPTRMMLTVHGLRYRLEDTRWDRRSSLTVREEDWMIIC